MSQTMPSLAWLLVAYGMCFGLQNDKILILSNLLRKVPILDRMLACSYCTGFHCGWVCWVMAFILGETQASLVPSLSMLAWALTSSAFCYVLDTAVKWIESNTSE